MSTPITKKLAALDPGHLDAVARMFAALAEPTRLRILQLLERGPLTVSEIVRQLQIKQANASKQLGVLHDARLVARQREGNLVRYSIAEPIVFEICGLVCGKIHRDAQAVAKAYQA